MTPEPVRHVVVLAPMPLELKAIVTAFGLSPAEQGPRTRWTGVVGQSAVTAIHVGMGPGLTQEAASRLLDEPSTGSASIAHIMIAGICGGLDPDVPVGTLINPELITDHTTGKSWKHCPPGDDPRRGKLLTTDGVTLDATLGERLRSEGYLGVDMESAAVAQVCDSRGCPWSVFRCIGDRLVDGLIDERVLSLTNPDGSANSAELKRLLESDTELAARLAILARDSSAAARRAAEAARRGCLALDT
jgi:adenosylhomocysteine nucleosidase